MSLSHENLRNGLADAEASLQELDNRMDKIALDHLDPNGLIIARASVLQLIDEVLAGFENHPVLGPLKTDITA